MPADFHLKNAKVLSKPRERTTKHGNRMLILFVNTWRNRGRKGEEPNFVEDGPFNVTIFNADGLNIDQGDKLNITGYLKVDTNPNWVQVRKNERFDQSVEPSESKFLDLTAIPANVEVVEKGDRTSTSSDRQARKAERNVDYPSNDFDGDDLPF